MLGVDNQKKYHILKVKEVAIVSWLTKHFPFFLTHPVFSSICCVVIFTVG